MVSNLGSSPASKIKGWVGTKLSIFYKLFNKRTASCFSSNNVVDTHHCKEVQSLINGVQNSLLPTPPDQILLQDKIRWLKSGNEASTHPIRTTGWEKCGLEHFIQVCRLQLLSWYLHFLAIQANSIIVFPLIKFPLCCQCW